jgi:hypothetical protein
MTNTTLDVISTLKDHLKSKHENTEHISFQFGDVGFDASAKSNENDSVIIQGSASPLTNSAFNQLMGVVNIPVSYANRIEHDLLNYNVNHLLKGRKDSYYSALVEDGVIRSFMPTTSPYVSGYDMFSAIEEVFDGDYDLKYVKANDVKTSYSILPHEYKNAIDDSNLFGGIKVEFSDSWNIFPSLDTYIWRELCSNGMIDTLKSRKFRIKDSSADEVLSQVRDFASMSLDRLNDLFEQYKLLLEEPVVDYVRLISRICSEHKLPNKVKERILFWAEQDVFLSTISNSKIENMHDIVNLFTFVGSHDLELTDENRQLLMEIGGNLTMSHIERCGSCGTSV